MRTSAAGDDDAVVGKGDMHTLGTARESFDAVQREEFAVKVGRDLITDRGEEGAIGFLLRAGRHREQEKERDRD